MINGDSLKLNCLTGCTKPRTNGRAVRRRIMVVMLE